jgi:hypothetical protein
MFNLRDAKNPHFIKAVICGQIHTSNLATMEVREMASEEMKKARLTTRTNLALRFPAFDRNLKMPAPYRRRAARRPNTRRWL